MQFVQEYLPIDEKLQLEIRGYMQKDPRKFDDSMVYNSQTKEKVLIPEKRQSEFKVFLCHEHPELTKMCQNYVAEINKMNKNINFLMVQNDITHIKYSAGGFFRSHEDYLSVTSNLIEEYTLIMCLDANSVGGETILHLNEHFKHISKATTTNLHALIFRKDITHEGALIKEGHKEIMTINLWGIRMNETNRIIIVSFIKDNVVDKRTYVFTIEEIMSCNETNLLKTFVNFKDQSKDQPDNVIRYEEFNFTYEQFNIIAQIYKKQKIDYNLYYESLEIIDYYGFDWQNLLITIYTDTLDIKPKEKSADSDDLESDDEPDNDKIVKSKLLKTKKSKSKKLNNETNNESNKESNNETKSKSNNETNNDLILCGDRAKYLEFMDIVKNTQMQYMPFKMILAEGTFQYGGEMEGTPPLDLIMQPVWLSVSERNNMFYYGSLVTKGDPTDYDILSRRKFEGHHLGGVWEKFIQKTKDEDKKEKPIGKMALKKKAKSTSKTDEDIEILNEYNYQKFAQKEDGQKIQINFTFDDPAHKDNIIDVFLDEDNMWNGRTSKNYSLLCYTNEKNSAIVSTMMKYDGLLEEDEKFNLYKSGNIKDITLETENYVIDTQNNLAIQPKHFPKIITTIQEMNLPRMVIERLNKIKFNLPQRKDSYEHFFCNEAVYGNFNFLIVYGFFKM